MRTPMAQFLRGVHTKQDHKIKHMDTRQVALIVTAVTVLANIVFAMTGVTASVSCSVSQGIAAAHAAYMESIEK